MPFLCDKVTQRNKIYCRFGLQAGTVLDKRETDKGRREIVRMRKRGNEYGDLEAGDPVEC